MSIPSAYSFVGELSSLKDDSFIISYDCALGRPKVLNSALSPAKQLLASYFVLQCM